MKAIARIEREIDNLIAFAPAPHSNDPLGSIEQSNARLNAAALVASLQDLYTKHED